MPSRRLVVSDRTFELAVEETRLRILRLAEHQHLESDVLLAALADVVGFTAATLDAHGAVLPLDERIDPIIKRARGAYERTVRRMAAVRMG